MVWRRTIICLILIAGAIAVYYPVSHFGFIDFDDTDYVTNNPHMLTGLTLPNLSWAFTTFYEVNYHPLMWVSLLLDRTLFGLRPQLMHIENVFFHAANSILLFLILVRATKDFWTSAFVAGVFVVHPTHVESVAWISERKDVLSTFFSMLALLCYLKYVNRSDRNQKWIYCGVLLLYACSLLAKSMLVTFPFVLLLLDVWPLRRIHARNWMRITLEKIPLLMLSIAASVLTSMAQQETMASLKSVTLGLRLANALVSYLSYISKNFWPVNLAVFYPYRTSVSPGTWLGSLTVLLIVTSVLIMQRLMRPYLIVGWLWFLGTLVPVIGIVQVGQQSIADRYLYFPSVGLSIMIAWCLKDLNLKRAMPLIATVAVAILLILGMTARHQVWYWQDKGILLGRASRLANGDAVTEVRIGYEAARIGDSARAEQHYHLALKTDPNNYAAEFDLGNLFLKDQPSVAARHFERAAEIDPAATAAQVNWGVALLRLNQPADAFNHFQSAERLDPSAYDPHYNLGQMFLIAHRLAAAKQEFLLALQARPDDAAALQGLQAAKSLR